uniref:Ankyrin repeat domain-containing protein 11-like isoform X2 n=1 Tax=Petromyzon marinus TaxID=7757 RepID=A0AAJ7UFL4_PETMA|nr:ankyrin repeat domain-containing protein 11-like isoform X2 [Petromyzon marinus]
MTHTGAYVLHGKPYSRLQVPTFAPPPSLSEPLKELFRMQEAARRALRLQQLVEREKLVLSCEQEVLRVHCQAARRLAKQGLPLAAYAVLVHRDLASGEREVEADEEEEADYEEEEEEEEEVVDEEVDDDEDLERSRRSRRRRRRRQQRQQQQRIPCVEDVEKRYENVKTAVLMRQQQEAAALSAVQRLEWLVRADEADGAAPRRHAEDVSDFYVPTVDVSDDFDLLPC